MNAYSAWYRFIWNSANANAENRIAVFSPYLRSLLMSCLRNIHSSKIGAQITRNTTFQMSICETTSARLLFALPPDRSIASMTLTILAT